MKTQISSLSMITLTMVMTACSIDQNHEISGTYADIKEMQILDPMAPENNAGVVNALNGVVGQKVMQGYQATTYSPKEGRAVVTFSAIE
ncbi:hypothetical protein [Psychromonas hadalis]|uniref:hypothetical protein n=1 Tax=Psychromonas hadalis TaxID=211669 RepID=UPI0003B5F8EE|nr:hypothetical protein [Psychromonas hadalis]